MPQDKKRKASQKQEDRTPDSTERNQSGKRIGLVLASIIIAVILAILGIGYYLNYVAPFQRTIITVDDITINMDYFLKRTQLAGANSMVMLEQLTKEQVIKLEASHYGIEVSPEDIDQELRRIARGESENITENEFKEWYRQQLNETKLSNAEFREITTINFIANRLQQYLGERMPTIAQQIHLNAIIVATEEEAQKIRARWEKGEKFADLARAVSLDNQSKEKGGDLGWFPRGILPPQLDYNAFNLSTDNVSEPIAYNTSNQSSTEPVYIYFLLMVSEKADARALDENPLQVLKDRVLDTWYPEALQRHQINYNFNSEVDAWINWQLAKKRGSQSPSPQ
ncbi:MAG: peptidylprolyl isomerase [Chloroflexi bacterium]|nr:peptidylprolyl isomerase [Chloroflexota bacterium]